MSADASQLTLPPTANNDDCQSFVAALNAAKGNNVEINASESKQLTARLAQLLVLAKRSWSMESFSLRIVEPSDPFLTALERLGLSGVLLAEGDAE